MDSSIEDNEDNEMNFDEETEELESKEAAPMPRKRGRKKGVLVGPRPTVWVCAAIVDGDLVIERFSAPEGSTFQDIEKFSSDDASAAFVEIYNVEPDCVEGPFHAKKGGKYISAAKKRETVSIPTPNLTSRRENATYKGWKGTAYGIEGREDVIYFMYNTEINPSPDKKKSPPTAKVIFRDFLQFQE